MKHNLATRTNLIATGGLVLLLSCLPTSASEFAADGTAGTLSFKITTTGGAAHKGGFGSGVDSREWQIKNSGQFSMRLRAFQPGGDTSTENLGKAEKVRSQVMQGGGNDQDVIDQWEEKIDECDGNETCENKVRGRMMADPKYQRIIQRMQGNRAGAAKAIQEVSVAPRTQLWTTDPMATSTTSGAMELNYTEKVFGAIDTGGGPKVDVTCQYQDKVNIAPGSAESKVGTTLLIDGKTSRYEIRIPAEVFYASVNGSCMDSKTGPKGKYKQSSRVTLVGSSPPRGVKAVKDLFTFKGPVGSARSPQLSGKHTVAMDWRDGESPQPIPVKVSIEWSFAAGGR